LTEIFVIDGSRRSNHSNAYFYGLFKKKRIVLYDTLLKQANTPEIISILAHELGHWYNNHIYKQLIINQGHLFLLFFLFSKMISNQNLYQSFGFDSKPVIIGFILFLFIYGPIDHIFGFFQNFMSRMNEFEADSYSKKLGFSSDLKSALIKLHTENLGNVNPDSWYSTYHYSHPPLVERLNAM
jgi:STE24 endopeptidase